MWLTTLVRKLFSTLVTFQNRVIEKVGGDVFGGLQLDVIVQILIVFLKLVIYFLHSLQCLSILMMFLASIVRGPTILENLDEGLSFLSINQISEQQELQIVLI